MSRREMRAKGRNKIVQSGVEAIRDTVDPTHTHTDTHRVVGGGCTAHRENEGPH